MPALTIKLDSSRYYCVLLLTVGVLSLVAIILATPSLVATMVICLLFILPYYRYFLFAGINHHGIDRVSYCEESWAIQQAGVWVDVALIHVQNAWPGMLVLIFRKESEGKVLSLGTKKSKIALTIFSDMLSDQAYRQLCARARYAIKEP